METPNQTDPPVDLDRLVRLGEVVVDHTDGYEYAGPFRDGNAAWEWVKLQKNARGLTVVAKIRLPLTAPVVECEHCQGSGYKDDPDALYTCPSGCLPNTLLDRS
jgi:hypothetical protein